LPWITSNTPEAFRTLLYPDVRRDPRKSPALRSYLPGENVEFAAMIYNAKSGKEQKPELESQFMLYNDGNELFRSKSKPVDLDDVSDFKRIPIRTRLRLGDSIPAGDYVLLLQVKDKRAKEKVSLATQALDFKVLAK
jgi:hypothetical protein